jgi:hypothetical protein
MAIGKLDRNCEESEGLSVSIVLGSTLDCPHLVVRPLSVLGGTIHILVDSTSVDHARVDVVGRILFGRFRDPVAPLKVGLEQVRPFLVGNGLFLAVD